MCGVPMFGVDKFPYPHRKTRDNECIPCSKLTMYIPCSNGPLVLWVELCHQNSLVGQSEVGTDYGMNYMTQCDIFTLSNCECTWEKIVFAPISKRYPGTFRTFYGQYIFVIAHWESKRKIFRVSVLYAQTIVDWFTVNDVVSWIKHILDWFQQCST